MDAFEMHVIEPGRSLEGYWRDLWRFRELAYFLALRDVLVRYKQTAIGVAWSVVRPLLTMLALTWVFSRGARLETPDPSIPYALWVFVATLPWQFFADALVATSNSLVSNASMITKVYFPRLILPASRVFVSFLDFSISALILAALVLIFHFGAWHFTPSWRVIFLPLFLLSACVASLGCGIWFATLNVQFRDFVYIVPFLVTFGIYVSPVGLSTDQFVGHGGWLRAVYSLNPMVGAIDGFRWCMFGRSAPLFFPGQAVSTLTSLLLLWTGCRYFRRFEQTFSDII